jgi:hypothetical protein
VNNRLHRTRRNSAQRWTSLFLFAASVCLTGCVERHLIVRTEPRGAAVSIGGIPIGEGPVVYPFSYYGTVRVEATMPGYHPALSAVQLTTPWYQWFPLDFVSDNLLPWTIYDDHEFVLHLQPRPPWDEEGDRQMGEEARKLLERAERVRAAGGEPVDDAPEGDAPR